MFALSLTKEHTMPAEPISMRKLKEILRLKYESKLSNRKIGNSLSVSSATVSNYINRARLIGIKGWPLPPDWDDIKLSQHFWQTKISRRTAIPLRAGTLHWSTVRSTRVSSPLSASLRTYALLYICRTNTHRMCAVRDSDELGLSLY